MSSCGTACRNKNIADYNRSVRQGETLEMTGRTNDSTAETVTLTVWDATGVKLTVPATFVDGRATVEAGIVALPIATYFYSLTVEYIDGKIDILPDSETCSGVDCAFPELKVCSGGYDE